MRSKTSLLSLARFALLMCALLWPRAGLADQQIRADFDGDGKLDLAVDSWGENKVLVLLGNGDGTFQSPGAKFAVGQAPYERLKTAMAAEPKAAAGRKALRSDALIIAEGGNLLRTRLPERDAYLWSRYRADSRDAPASTPAQVDNHGRRGVPFIVN